jgi:transcriptional regulator with XRE-family HTH domain
MLLPMLWLRIRELASARGMSLAQLQRRAGLSVSTARRYWHNEVRSVSLDALADIARVLQVSPGDLLADQGAILESPDRANDA